MREIKFRVWQIVPNRMVLWEEIGRLHTNTWLPENDYTRVMQYTGLRDKNGREIYEGDIVRRSGSKTTVAVSWGTGSFQGFYGYTGWIVGDGVDESFDPGDAKEYEVIGNIYENPELLREEASE